MCFDSVTQSLYIFGGRVLMSRFVCVCVSVSVSVCVGACMCVLQAYNVRVLCFAVVTSL